MYNFLFLVQTRVSVSVLGLILACPVCSLRLIIWSIPWWLPEPSVWWAKTRVKVYACSSLLKLWQRLSQNKAVCNQGVPLGQYNILRVRAFHTSESASIISQSSAPSRPFPPSIAPSRESAGSDSREAAVNANPPCLTDLQLPKGMM